MRTEAFNPWLCTCVLMMARFSEFPLAKQELPRQTTISTTPSSWGTVHLFIAATAQIAKKRQAWRSCESRSLLFRLVLVPQNGRASESVRAGIDRSEEH